MNSVQNHLTFPIRGSCSSQRYLLLGECYLLTARSRAVALQNPLNAKENFTVHPQAFRTLVLSEFQAPSGVPTPPWWPSRWFPIVVKVAVMFFLLYLRPPKVCPWFDQIQKYVSLVFSRAASLAVELNFDRGAELRFAAYSGAAAAEFGAVPLPTSTGSKPQPHGTCHSLRGLTFVTLLEGNVCLVSSDNC